MIAKKDIPLRALSLGEPSSTSSVTPVFKVNIVKKELKLQGEEMWLLVKMKWDHVRAMFGFSISLLFISDEISEGLLIEFIDKKRAADNRNGCSKFEVIFPCDLGLYKAHCPRVLPDLRKRAKFLLCLTHIPTQASVTVPELYSQWVHFSWRQQISVWSAEPWAT